MLVNGWKKTLERSGYSQRALAKKLNVNFVELNMVAQGRAFLTPEKFELACEVLDCQPTSLYEADVLSLMYGRDAKPQRKRGIRVELEPRQQMYVEALARRNDTSRSRAVNDIIELVIEKGLYGI